MSKDKGSSDDMMFSAAILLVICMVVTMAYRFFLYKIIPFVVRFYFYHYYSCLLILTLLTAFVLAWAAYGISRLFEGGKRKVDAHVKEPDLVIGLCAKTRKPVVLTTKDRTMHAGAMGTTGFGKSESVVIPWSVDDIKNGRGLIIMDGKCERSFLEKLYAYAAKHNRTKDVRVFSLFEPEISSTYNPLLGGSAEEIAERIFNSFEFENEFYKTVQIDCFTHLMRIFEKAGQKPTFLRISQALSDPRVILKLAEKTDDDDLKFWAKNFCGRPATDIQNEIKGLLVNINRFAFGEFAPQFNADNPSISIRQVMKENLIVYFQLPAMQFEDLGKSTGRIVIQDIMSQIANRHKGKERNHRFFSIYMDDFSEYLHANFVTVLNKSRSANVGCVFSHQALGDLQTLGDAIANAITTNTNIKVLMRTNEPDTADYLSRMIGTRTTEKTTERRRRSLLSTENTGEMSVRETEEFIYHPRVFKSELQVGEAVVATPSIPGVKVRLYHLPDLPILEIPEVEKIRPKGIDKKSLGIEDSAVSTKPDTSGRTETDSAKTGSLLANDNLTNKKGEQNAA